MGIDSNVKSMLLWQYNLSFDPNHLDQIPINGLTPVIFQITPVTDLPLLLGLAEDQAKELSAVR